MNDFDLLAQQARRDLVAEADRIADTDSAYDDLVRGVQPMTLAPDGTPTRLHPRRTLAIATTLALVAAAVAIGVLAVRHRPSADITVVPATDAPAPAPTTSVEVPPVESLVPPGVATTSIAPVPGPGTEAVSGPTSVFPPVGIAPLDPTIPVVPAPAWDSLDLGPLSPRWDPVVVSTGHELVVLGGWVGVSATGNRVDERVGDGAAYDPVSGTWRLLADPDGLFATTTAAIATGDDLLLAGPNFASTYNVATGEHQTIDPPPFSDGGFWTTPTAIFTAIETAGSVSIAVLRRDSSTWETLPSLDLRYLRTILKINDRFVVLGGIDDNGAVAGARTLTDTGWADLPLPNRNWLDYFATTDGHRLLMWAGYGFQAEAADLGTGLWVDPSIGEWHELAPVEERWWECSADGIPVPGGVVIDDCGEVVHYHSAHNTATARPELTMWGSRGGLPIVLLGDHLYRWGEPTYYAEGPNTPEAMQFGRLALVPA